MIRRFRRPRGKNDFMGGHVPKGSDLLATVFEMGPRFLRGLVGAGGIVPVFFLRRQPRLFRNGRERGGSVVVEVYFWGVHRLQGFIQNIFLFEDNEDVRRWLVVCFEGMLSSELHL